jgi:4-amino-4-deoxy-L-arabinose transferase-like glycosyltransferase
MSSVAPQQTTVQRRRVWFWSLGLLVVACYLGIAVFHVPYGSMNVDEGFYAAATRAVWRGDVPYRDFGFTQPPLVVYVNAPLLQLTGFGLFQQRALNGLWGLLALLLGARVLAQPLF